MANHLCALVEGRFEHTTEELVFAIFTGLARDHAPHVGDKDDVLQCCFPTKLAEYFEIPSGYSRELYIGDAADVDDTGKLNPLFISVEEFSPND